MTFPLASADGARLVLWFSLAPRLLPAILSVLQVVPPSLKNPWKPLN